jgi:anion-transporting  ArsA/GET3 family ATPase
MDDLRQLLTTHRIIVCAGAGGVGKTTVSAALAMAAARNGRRVLVLTIDPSRRLAETLGIATNLADPIPLPADVLAAAGIVPPGSLDGWVLNPLLIAERAVDRLARTPEEARQLKTNRVYKGVSNMVAGMQEYTAVEALHGLTAKGRYDLIILDTPPSRNALSFLDAPIRLGKFLDGRILHLFIPHEDNILRSAARKIAALVLTSTLGKEAYADLTTTLSSFSAIFKVLSGNAEEMRQRLQQPDATFLMVTSSAQNAVHDALHFRKRLERLQLNCGGFVLNRTLMPDGECPMPSPENISDLADAETNSAYLKLKSLGLEEQKLADHEAALHARLIETAGERTLTIAVPELPGGVEDMSGLSKLVDRLATDSKD